MKRIKGRRKEDSFEMSSGKVKASLSKFERELKKLKYFLKFKEKENGGVWSREGGRSMNGNYES